MKNTAFVALGANLKKNKNLSLQENIQNALKYFPDQSIKLIEMSNWYKSEPFPKLNQPWYINAVVKITNKPNIVLIGSILILLSSKSS